MSADRQGKRRLLDVQGIALCVLSCWAASCADTGQERVEIPLYLAGSELAAPVSSLGGVPVLIEGADLAFGPLYLCAGNSAGDLCETARLEWLDTAVIDTTSDEPMAVGSLTGVSGSVHSWMYDLAISSQLTRSEPYLLDAARELGDSSFVLQGRILIEEVEIPFSASIPLQQNDTTELGVPVIRKASDEPFSREVTGEERSLTLRFDPSAWLARVDFRPYVENETCQAADSQLVCQGQRELSCDAEGSVIDSRDCGELGKFCLASQGCVDELVLERGSEAYRSLAIALATTGRPTFDWTD